MLRWVLFAALVLPASSRADELLMVAGGLAVRLSPDGHLSWASSATIPLDDGRLLKREGDIWKLEPKDVGEIKSLSALDLAVYHQDYSGKRVSVTSELYDAAVVAGKMQLPGNVFVSIDFDYVPRDQVKDLIEKCAGIKFDKRPICVVQVTGTVEPRSSLDHLRLVEVIIKRSPVSARR